MAIVVNLSGLLCPSACGVQYVPYWQHLQVTYMTRGVRSSILFKIIITMKWIKNLFLLKKKMYILQMAKWKIKGIFYINNANGIPFKEDWWGLLCRMLQCCCTGFVTSACCTEYIACVPGVEWASCSSWCTAACWDGKLRLRCIFILYIFVYITILPCSEHGFCYICLFLFPTKVGP